VPIRVVNLVSGDEQYLDATFGPVGALATAYARAELKVPDALDCARAYGHLVRQCGELFRLGDWVCWAKRN
jgi:hypothetical protein